MMWRDSMTYHEEIAAYQPANEQERSDLKAMLWYLEQYGDGTLLRDNVIAHITSSGFIMNAQRSRVLMVHHNIRDAWAWTGGHADGDTNLLAVAIREAQEETGAQAITAMSTAIASIDVLTVEGHVRRGVYVSAHLHLSVAYLLCCDEDEPLRVKPDENSGVRWMDATAISPPAFSPHDIYLYGKLIARARNICSQGTPNPER